MKIQHWAIIFIIIMLPLSIVCRNIINKKNLNLRDETKYNNIVDNATYDAVSQILELAEELGYGKNIPITKNVALASIDRFFNTLSVNFNLPFNDEGKEGYFNQYIPAIIIVGYDGLYVYSCENTANGYEFKLKPKIPYSYTYKLNNGKSVLINFTLDNYVTMYFPDDIFMEGMPDAEGSLDGTHMISGYIGEFLDVDQNGVDDLGDMLTTDGYLVQYDPAFGELYLDNDDPYGLNYEEYQTNRVAYTEYVMNQLPTFTDNLSYVLEKLADGTGVAANRAKQLKFLYDDTVVSPNQDYEYNELKIVIKDASEFHKLRRETIINLITSIMREEFNEHNSYAKTLGITYEFNVPDIGRDQWNNTIDDISVLAFMQGMPMGGDIYYNNYSLGGSRIVQTNYLYAETVIDGSGREHKVYHKYYCPLIPKDSNMNPRYSDGSTFINGSLPDGSTRRTKGIEEVFINSDHAKQKGYYICSECM